MLYTFGDHLRKTADENKQSRCFKGGNI